MSAAPNAKLRRLRERFAEIGKAHGGISVWWALDEIDRLLAEPEPVEPDAEAARSWNELCEKLQRCPHARVGEEWPHIVSRLAKERDAAVALSGQLQAQTVELQEKIAELRKETPKEVPRDLERLLFEMHRPLDYYTPNHDILEALREVVARLVRKVGLS